MAQPYDTALKAMFLRDGDGIIRRQLFGGKVSEVLPTEQPQVYNQRADLVVRTTAGRLHHVEFQATNEVVLPRRILRYYIYLEDTYGVHVTQTVLYMGREPMRLNDTYATPTLHFRFAIVNLRELDAEPLLASPDWVDNVLALIAKGSPERALDVLLPRIRALKGEEQELAAGALTLLSGILGMEAAVSAKLLEVGMIDVMENKILGPAIRQGLAQGREQGRQEMLREQLLTKFGLLPEWASQRLQSASSEELSNWARRILTSTTLEDTLRH